MTRGRNRDVANWTHHKTENRQSEQGELLGVSDDFVLGHDVFKERRSMTSAEKL